MTLSVIICTRNRPNELKYLIDNILNQNILPDEIIIVDSSDNISVNNNYNSEIIKYIPFSLYPSLTKQRNVGIKHAIGEIIVFLDDDVLLCENYFNEIKKAFLDKDLLGASGNIIVNNRKVTHIIQYIFYFIFWGNTFTEIRAGIGPTILYPIRKNRITNRLSGCNMAIRRSVFNSICFDEHFSDYSLGEDIEFSLTASKYGKLFYLSEAKIIHSKSSLNRYTINTWYNNAINNYWYITKKHFTNSIINSYRYFIGSLGLLIEYLIKCLLFNCYNSNTFKRLFFNITINI